MFVNIFLKSDWSGLSFVHVKVGIISTPWRTNLIVVNNDSFAQGPLINSHSLKLGNIFKNSTFVEKISMVY